MKTCNLCHIEKPESEFYTKKTRNGKTILRWICKSCHANKRREYYLKNRDKELKKNIEWEKEHREARNAIFRKWTGKCRYYTLKRQNDIGYKIRKDVSSRVNRQLRGKKDGESVFSILGYSCAKLKRHLLNTMPTGYSWEDYLGGKLHVDHKIPVSAFNITSETDIDFRRCWALSNLRLLPAAENLRKSNKILYPFQPSIAWKSGVDMRVEH